MSDILLKLQKELPENILETLTLVTAVADNLQIPAFIVGATARDIILEYVYRAGIRRATDDIDFGVAVGWEQYERLKAALISTGKFRADNKFTEKLSNITASNGAHRIRENLFSFV